MVRFIRKLFIIGVVLFLIHTYIGTMTIYYNNNMYPSVKDGDLIQKQLISHLALNDMDLSKIESKTVSIAMLPQCATAKKWLFDFDYENEEQVLEFIEDIKDADPTVEVKYKKTVHGYAVITSHGFDTRALLAKWSDCENKRDGMLLVDWKVK